MEGVAIQWLGVDSMQLYTQPFCRSRLLRTSIVDNCTQAPKVPALGRECEGGGEINVVQHCWGDRQFNYTWEMENKGLHACTCILSQSRRYVVQQNLKSSCLGIVWMYYAAFLRQVYPLQYSEWIKPQLMAYYTVFHGSIIVIELCSRYSIAENTTQLLILAATYPSL